MPLGTAIAFNVPGLYWHLEHLDFLCGSQLSIAVTKRRGGGLTCAPEVSFHNYVVLLSEGLWWGSRSQRNIRWIRCSPHSSWAMKCSGHKSASKVRLQKLNCLQLDPVHFSRLQFRNCPSCQILCTLIGWPMSPDISKFLSCLPRRYYLLSFPLPSWLLFQILHSLLFLHLNMGLPGLCLEDLPPILYSLLGRHSLL